MAYFTQFPLIEYDINGSGNLKVVPDIFRKIILRNKYRENFVLFDRYDVRQGEKPEDVAYNVYGDAEYHWVILLTNQMNNRFYDWPLGYQEFENYVNAKYDEPGAVHHYEKLQSSGVTTSSGPADYDQYVEVNSDDPDGQSVSNYEYEQRLQDQKRQIKILVPSYLPEFVSEFRRLVRR